VDDPDDDLTLAQLLAKKKNLPLVQVKKEVDDPDDDLTLAQLLAKKKKEVDWTQLPVAEVVAEPVDPDDDLTLAQLLAKKKDLPLVQVKKEVDWTQLPDELLTYIGSFIDINRMDAQRRYDIVNAKYTAEKIPYHIDLWKPYAKITSKLVKLNEGMWSKRERRDIKQIKQDDPNIANYFAEVRDTKYSKQLTLMRIRYRHKYWRGVKSFMDLNGEVVQFNHTNYLICLPYNINYTGGPYIKDMYEGPLNAIAGRYEYGSIRL
jgi:hypothetical protein